MGHMRCRIFASPEPSCSGPAGRTRCCVCVPVGSSWSSCSVAWPRCGWGGQLLTVGFFDKMARIPLYRAGNRQCRSLCKCHVLPRIWLGAAVHCRALSSQGLQLLHSLLSWTSSCGSANTAALVAAALMVSTAAAAAAAPAAAALSRGGWVSCW